MQQQDNEITLLKAALADALRRIGFYDQHFTRLQPTLAGSVAFPPPLGLTGPTVASVSSDQTSVRDQTPVQDPPPSGSTSCPPSRRTNQPGAEAPASADPSSPGPERPPASGGDRDGREESRAEDGRAPRPPDGVGLSRPQPAPPTAARAPQAGLEDPASQPGAENVDPIPAAVGVQEGGRGAAEAQESGLSEPEAYPSPWGAEASNGPGAPPLACLGRQVPPVPEEELGSQQLDLHPSPLEAAIKKKVLLRRCSTSDKLRGPRDGVLENHRPRLAKKSASSQSLLSKGRNMDSRNKEPPQSPVATSRRGFYNQEGISIKMFLRGRPITMYVPLQAHNYEELKMELPVEKLKLDWVYGYRGRDSRDNLHLLPSGEVVYFIACVVVLYSIEDQTQRHYLRHTDCVRCLAIHPDGVRIASGQAAGVDKDGKPLLPCVHIWDSVTLQTLQHIGMGSFERGVGSLAFSKADSGAFLCIIDDSNEHLMSVWDCTRGTRQAEAKTTNEAVLEVEFNPADSSCIVSCGKSHVYFWTWSGSSLTKKQGIFGKYKKPKFIQCFVFLRSGEVLTGDSEGNILVWGKAAADTKTLGKGAKETYQIARQVRAHEGSIFTLCVGRDGGLLSGGGKDRKVILWGADLTPERETEIPERYGAVRTLLEGPAEELLIGTTRNAILRGSLSQPFTPIVQGHTDELWGLATHPFHDLFLTCAHDRQVCVWDQEQHTLAWSKMLEGTGLCADFHCSGTVVIVGLQNGR
ncbi:echinoderm microtubule-associated protein-like 3 isoform X2 [Pristis pectinata]|nr:echinoderm microtubule-associated protein-like 3 isoform X2 [Pristis pectinata]